MNAHINIFYLRDKVLEHRVLHERFEAISVLQRSRSHASYDHMLRQLIERLPLIIDGEPMYLPILDEVIKLIVNADNMTILDLLISKLRSHKAMVECEEDSSSTIQQ